MVDISRIFILVEFGGILRLVESSRFLRFYFRFGFRAVRYKVFLLIMGGGK